jgi:hypothetical protein
MSALVLFNQITAGWNNLTSNQLIKYLGASSPLDQQMKQQYGALRWIRTTDRSVRSRVLYPAEL